MRKEEVLKVHVVKVLPLYGVAQMFETFADALVFIKEQPDNGMRSAKPFVRMEVTVRYTDGTFVEGGFPNKRRAMEFLKNREKGIL